MFFEKYFERWKLLLAFLTGTCFVIYFIMFRPLASNVADMEKKLIDEKQKIILNARYGFNASSINQSYFNAREENKQLSDSLEAFRNHFTFSPLTVVSNVTQEFKYLEFDSERRRLISQIDLMSSNSKVVVDADLSLSLPNYPREGLDPRLLWAHLEMFRFLMETIMAVDDIKVTFLEAPDAQLFDTFGNEGAMENWYELPARCEVSGPGDKVIHLLRYLPLPAGDLERAYGVVVPDKPAFSVNSVLITRETQDPSTVFMDLQVSGFIQQPVINTGEGMP